MPEKPGFVQLTAAGKKADNTALTNSPLTFTAFADTGAANIMEKAIPGDPELVGVAGKALSQKVRVKISDKFGNAVKHGYPVTFTVMDGGGRVNSATQVTVQTADSGYASVTWVMGTASGYESNVLKANASVANNPELEFKATVVADIAAIMSPQPISDEFVKAGNLLSDPVSVKITDQYGNGINKFPVLFQVVDVDGNMGYLEVQGQTSYTDSTDENGIAQVNWGMGPNVGLNINKLRVVAQRNGIDLENSPYEGYLVSTSVGDPDSLIKITDEPLESVVGNTVTLSVKVTDAFGNPRAAQPVEFKVLSATTAGGGYFDGDEEKIEITKNSDSNGHVTVQFTLGNLAGVNINKVQISSAYNGEPLNGSPALYEISAKSTNATRIAIEDGDDQNGTVGKFVDEMLKVVAYDRDGNRVTQPQPIRFQIVDGETKGGALGHGTAIDTTINTNSSGVAEIAWRLGPKVGAYEVNASSKSGSTNLDGSPLTFSANAAADITNADTSKVDVFPPVQVVSNGGNKITIVARLKDKFGNPIKDRAVVFSAINANGVTITQPIQATDINGEASGQVYSTTVGIKQIVCRDINSQVQLSDTARVTFTAAAAARIDEHQDSGDGGAGNIGTVLGDSLRVLVTDEFGNPIDNHDVSFGVTAGNGQLLENQPVSTDSTGMAFVRYRLGQEPGTNTIEAIAIGIAGQKVRFNLIAEDNNPAQIKMVSGNKSSAKAGEQLPEPFVVRVVDAYNKPVWNVEVLWKGVLNPGSIVSENPITTDEYGKASANVIVSSTVGENIYSAEIPSSPSISAQTFYATTTANKATGIEYGTDSELEGVVNQSLTQALVINTVDEHGNRVPSVNVTFTVMEGETVDGVGKLQNGAKVMSISSNASGQALAYYTLGKKAGINRVRASSAGLEPTYREFVITGVADVADSMFVYSGNNQKMEKGKELLEPIVVRVVDQWGNPASNGRVSFAAIQGGGTIIADNPVSSNNQGLAKARWILGPTANVSNIAVVISNNNLKFAGDRLEFLATAESNQYPEFQMLERYEVYENELLQFFVLATDGDGDFVNYNKANMPADTSAKFLYDTINEKYKFQWKPGYDLVQRPETEKTYYPVFYAEDTKGGRDIDTVKVVVKNKNRMPVINSYVPIDNYYKFNLEDGVIEFSVSATDPDNDALYYTWRVGDVVKGNSQSFTLNPYDLYPNLNNISVSVEVSDGENSTSFNWTLSSVQLTSFTADVTPYQGVILEWETASEHNNAGFNVLRSMKEDGTYAKINKDLLDPEVDGKYEYIDNEIEGGYHYYYKIEDVSLSGIRTQHGPVTAEAPLPKDFNLSQNYPNPFNPTTTVRYELPKTAQVRLDIYNTMGQLVKTLINRQVKAGYHTVMWNGKDENQMTVSSGIYYYRIKAGNFSRIHKMVFLK